MAGCAFASRLWPLVRGRFCKKPSVPGRTAAFSSTATRSQFHQVHGINALTGKVDRFGGVTVNLAEIGLPEDISEGSFSALLRGVLSSSLQVWMKRRRRAMFMLPQLLVEPVSHPPALQQAGPLTSDLFIHAKAATFILISVKHCYCCYTVTTARSRFSFRGLKAFL